MLPANLECAEFLAIALAELDGQAGESDFTLVIAHMQVCVPCSHEYRMQRQVKSLVHRTAGCTVAPEGLRMRVVQSIRDVTEGSIREERIEMTIEFEGRSEQ